MIDETLLDRVARFRDLNPRARRELAARSSQLRVKAGGTLWRAGDPPRGLVVLLTGRVRVIRSNPEGRRHVIHREGPGVVLGEVPLLDGGGYPGTAEAEVEVTAILVSPGALEAAIQADASFARVLMEGLARRVRHLVDRLDSLASVDVRSRLARHLLARAATGPVFSLGMSQAHLAEELGTVREVVVRNLGALRRRG